MAEHWTDEEFIEIVQADFEKTTEKTFNIWEQVGLERKIIQKHKKKIYNQIQELLEDIENEAEEEKKKYKNKIKKMIKQIKTLSNELKIEVSMPEYQEESLIDATIILKNKIEDLEMLREHHLSKVQKLLDKECQICKHLGIQPIGFEFLVPDAEEINDFKSELSKLENELITRKNTFIHLQQSIVKIREEMALSSSNHFEQLILHQSQDFIYSSENMTDLKKLYDDLQEQRTIMEEKADNKRQELVKLYEDLDIQVDQYENFLTKYSGFDENTMKALDAEIEKLQKKQEEKIISKNINKQREELQYLWNKCRMNPEEIEKLDFYNLKTYNPETLKLYEFEVEKLQKYYESYKNILKTLDEWIKVWEQNKEYHRQIENPDRFVNRGAQLLAEEKLRQYLTENLPKVKKQLEEMVNEYEKRQGKTFTIYGLNLSEYFERQQQDLEIQIKELKATEWKARKEKSAKRTPLSACENLPYVNKQKANTSPRKKKAQSPTPNFSKSVRIVNDENVPPRVLGSKISKGLHSKARRELLSSFRNSSIVPKPRSISINNNEIINLNSSSNTP